MTGFHNTSFFEGTNVTFLNLVQGTNSIVGSWLGITLILIVAVVLFMVLLQKGEVFDNALVASLWVTMLLSILMYPIGLLPGLWLIGSIVLTSLATLNLWLGN